jgi:hypothetical protein
MARMIRCFLLVALSVAAAFAQPATPLFQQVDEMLASLSQITGWKVERKVPAQMLTKESFHHYVDSHMKDSSGREEIRAEEITLKMFGFVPQDFNLAKETVDLVSEQAAAYYDYNKKRLYVLDSTSEGMEQRVALVHELAHALADQHHPLGKYLRKGSPDDDAATARQAVMEGQATWLTWAYVSKRAGGKPEVTRAMLDQLTNSAGADGADFPVFTNSPLYMKESLVFPYNEGLRFQDAIFRKLGRESFDVLFTSPPASTQQILHPGAYLDAYLKDNKAPDPDPPALRDALGKKVAGRFRILAEGSMGEFDHSVLLRQYLPEKEGTEAASHWHGGSYRLYENKRDKYPVLTYISEWESPEAAQTFFALYQRVMKGKWKKMTVTSKNTGKITGSGDSGLFELTVSGKTVRSIEGLRPGLGLPAEVEVLLRQMGAPSPALIPAVN